MSTTPCPLQRLMTEQFAQMGINKESSEPVRDEREPSTHKKGVHEQELVGK